MWLSRPGPIIKPKHHSSSSLVLPKAGGPLGHPGGKEPGNGREEEQTADSRQEMGKDSCKMHHPGLVALQFSGKLGQPRSTRIQRLQLTTTELTEN